MAFPDAALLGWPINYLSQCPFEGPWKPLEALEGPWRPLMLGSMKARDVPRMRSSGGRTSGTTDAATESREPTFRSLSRGGVRWVSLGSCGILWDLANKTAWWQQRSRI